MNTQAMKHSLRQSIIAARQKLAAAEREAFSCTMTARLLALEGYRSAATVLGYMSFGAEYASSAWVQQVLLDGKQLLLPRVNRSSKELDLYRITDVPQDLAPGAWGIHEPLPERCRKLDSLHEVEFILLPGVAFARDGARLGYGGGFYDKLLARMPHQPVLVAAAFGMQLVPAIPQETTDRKVEWLVTEHETIHCVAQNQRGA
jgi:5-formyltetrahydrofolate cyclo-ligase